MGEPPNTLDVAAGEPRRRMRADERRASILAAALRVFGERSFASATTAMIAREAQITEPVLYHHFRNKADLYASCLDAAWDDLRDLWDAALEAESDPRRWLTRIADVGLRVIDEDGASRLWLNALADVTEDPEARERTVAFTRDLHSYLARAVRRTQAAGGLPDRLDPDAEAWMIISIGMLRALSRRFDGIVDPAFPAVLAARQAWYDTR